MKRYGYLYEKVITLDNVRAAWELYNSRRPVKLRRPYREAAARRILELMERDFAAVIGRPRVKYIFESGKERRLQIPSFRACVAMLALWNVCGPLVEKRIHRNSYSSRRGMGGHKLAKKVEKFVHTRAAGAARYCLYFDIKKFYDHIDKRIMMSRLECIFKDERILAMFRVILDSTGGGLSIGYPFSHALANLYLVPLYFLLRSVRAVSRVWVYMDNWLVFAPFKRALHRAIGHAKAWLKGMGCSVKGDWQIFPTAARGVKACGLVIHAARPGRLYRRLWRRTVRQFGRVLADLRPADYLGMMSRLGWLDMVNRRHAPIFKGGYLWK